MRIGEQILFALSRRPRPLDNEAPHGADDIDRSDPLEILTGFFPDYVDNLAGKSVVDFGCGLGKQSVALFEKGAARVLGIDTSARYINKARDYARARGVGATVEFSEHIADDHRGQFDIVVSQNSMEHFPDPIAAVMQMKSLLAPGGVILITFGPPWYAPYGSHMHFFTKFPWVNLLFSERTVMRVRSRFRNDGAQRYEDCELGLNRMTIRRFYAVLKACELRAERTRLDCVRGLNFLARVPGMRELFVNRVSCTVHARESTS